MTAVGSTRTSAERNDDEQVQGKELTEAFHDRYKELLEGVASGEPTWVTTGGPEGGVHGTLEGLSAEQASRELDGTSLAAHAEHLRWAIDLVNDYFAGTEPSADWSASWSVRTVDDAGWNQLRTNLRQAGEKLLANVRARQRWSDEMAMVGAFASYGHTAYHLGAMRQLRKRIEGRERE